MRGVWEESLAGFATVFSPMPPQIRDKMELLRQQGVLDALPDLPQAGSEPEIGRDR